MVNKVNQVLKDVLQDVKPSATEMKEIKRILSGNLEKINANIRKNRINADAFVGGSFAKGTMIKKESYDVDVFIRFDKKYKDAFLSGIAEKLLEGIRVERVHGSRDYFRAHAAENLILEFVPVRRIAKPREAVNVTDFSYSHVNYIKKKIKTEKMLDEVRLAKAFCHAQKCYGAESYVQGFSGYGLELLIYHYKGFLKFLKAIAKMNVNKKEVIDIEKQHKNKNHVLMDLNSAKLQSPIVLIDPTYKQRNVLAALSRGTFQRFQNAAKSFLKKPSGEFFEAKSFNLEKIKADAHRKGYEFILLEMSTNRQEGDIAGSKLLKFYRHLGSETEKLFNIKAKDFEYKRGKTAIAYIVGEAKPLIVITGPSVDQKKHTKRFRNMHKSVFVKNGRLYAKFKPNSTLETFIKKWNSKHRKTIVEMGITNLKAL